MAKFTVKTLAALVKLLASAVLLCLAVVGLAALIYPSTRADLLVIAQDLLKSRFLLFLICNSFTPGSSEMLLKEKIELHKI